MFFTIYMLNYLKKKNIYLYKILNEYYFSICYVIMFRCLNSLVAFKALFILIK